MREILENLKEDFSGYIEVVGKGSSLGQILFFDGRPRLALFEGESRYEGRNAITKMIEISKDLDTEIKVHRYPLVALLLDRFPEAEVTEETLGMPAKKPKEKQVDEGLFNRREELAAVLTSEPAYKPTSRPETSINGDFDPLKVLNPEEVDELRDGLMKRLNLEKFHRKKGEA